MTTQVVIGANYGDEGKGLITDYYAAQAQQGLVVRYNGGAQAGHTVVTPDGKRHVFGHFGSGSFLDLPTLLSRFFIVNPALYHAERQRLLAQGVNPRVYVDPRCRVTTPYDMWLNQLSEDARGKARHGSVGVGIWETIVRSEGCPLAVQDLSEQFKYVRELQDYLWSDWVPKRARELGCYELYEKRKANFDHEGIKLRWLADCMTFMQQVELADDAALIESTEHVIFEGAQGLALDHRVHPDHSTPSAPGLDNVITLADDASRDIDRVTYVTRQYLTRHGNGPLPQALYLNTDPQDETPGLPYERVVDMTNRPHRFQGQLRFAYLDIDAMWERIWKDLGGLVHEAKLEVTLAITCMDHCGTEFRWYEGGTPHQGAYKNFIEAVTFGADRVLLTYGPSRVTVLDITKPVVKPPVVEPAMVPATV